MKREPPETTARLPRFTSLSTKVVGWCLLFSALFTLVMTAGLVTVHYVAEKDYARGRLQLAANNFHKSLAASLWDVDMQSAQLQLEALAQFPFVDRVRLTTVLGQHFTLYHKTTSARLAPSSNEVSLAVQLTGPAPALRQVGTLELYADDAALWDRVRDDALRVLLAETLKGITLGLLLSFLITRIVTRHVRRMAQQAALLQPSSLDQSIELRRSSLHRPDELDQLCDSFNHLHRGLADHIQRQAGMEAELRRHKEDLSEMVEQRTGSLMLAQQALERANEELYAMSRHDALTEMANRRHFDEVKEIEFRRALRSGTPLAVLMCDIDDFKAYNDCYGHGQGDICLKALANCLRQLFVRAGELPARLGGEEFAVLLPNTNAEQAKALAERLRLAVMELKLPHRESRAAEVVTISIGVATLWHEVHRDFDSLLADADRALYEAKSTGRNAVVLAHAA